MKKITKSLFVPFLLSVFMLTACSQPDADRENKSEETILEAETEHHNEETSENAQMEALITEKIGDCHRFGFILSKNKTREEWSATIDRMIAKGAEINAEEKERIIEWLVSRNE